VAICSVSDCKRFVIAKLNRLPCAINKCKQTNVKHHICEQTLVTKLMRATWPQFAQVVLGGLMLACMILIGMQYLHVSDHLAALRPGTRSFQKTELTSQCLMRNCSVHQENIKNVCISEEVSRFSFAWSQIM